jgi:flagellar hook-basal body complex protein FliE
MTNPIEANIDSVLAQMRQMRAQAGNQMGDRIPSLDQAGVARTSDSKFDSVLGDALNKVNDMQLESGQRTSAYVSGESTDLVGTMVASQKANLGFQALVATRNRVVSAYQDIMNMPI